MEQRKGSVTITKASLCTTMERWGGGSLGAKTSKPAQLSCPHLHPHGLSGALLHLQTAFVRSLHLQLESLQQSDCSGQHSLGTCPLEGIKCSLSTYTVPDSFPSTTRVCWSDLDKSMQLGCPLEAGFKPNCCCKKRIVALLFFRPHLAPSPEKTKRRDRNKGMTP